MPKHHPSLELHFQMLLEFEVEVEGGGESWSVTVGKYRGTEVRYS